MKNILKAAAAVAAISAASTASAQVAGIGTANPVVALGNSKALGAAAQAIGTQFQANSTSIEAKERERQTALVKLDTNKDRNVDDAELAAAQKAKSPVLAQVETIEGEIARLGQPASMANLYALETLMQRYQAAETKVMADRRVTVLLKPEAIQSGAERMDVTAAITAELDRTVLTLPTAPPANWRPQQGTVTVARELTQLAQYRAYVQAAQQAQAQRQAATPAAGQPAAQPAPAATRPATPQPTGR